MVFCAVRTCLQGDEYLLLHHTDRTILTDKTLPAVTFVLHLIGDSQLPGEQFSSVHPPKLFGSRTLA